MSTVNGGDLTVSGVVEDAISRVAEEDRVYLPELAQKLGRREHTIRRWLGEARKMYSLLGGRKPPPEEGFLPDDLWPQEEPDGRRRMYWTVDQVEGMHEFAEAKAGRRGWQTMRTP
jgi:hypothetical protein